MIKLLKNTNSKFKERLKNRTLSQRVLLIILTIIKWLFLIFLFLFSILPVVWIIISSLKTNMEIFTAAISFPKVLQFQNYKNAFNLEGLWSAFRNTIIVSIASTALCIIISAMAAYALRNKFRMNRKIYTFLVIGMYIPVNAFMIPYLFISVFLNIYDTIWALILTYTAIGLPISILILKGYMDTIPNEICESAQIDGCSYHQNFRKIILPLSVPGMASVGIFQFITAWNEFLFATILTSRESSRTLQVSLRYFMGFFLSDYASAFATMVIALIPAIVIFIFLQERIISGLTSGALKG